MGSKKMPEGTTQDVQLTIRINRRDRDRLHALAKSHNMKLSTFLRMLPDNEHFKQLLSDFANRT